MDKRLLALILGQALLIAMLLAYFFLSTGEVSSKEIDICQAGAHTGPVSTSLRR